MRRASVLLGIAALVAVPAVALAAELFSANLTPEAEVPPATSEGSGSATVTISDDETQIDYEVTYADLSGPAGAAHIHYGAADVAGGVILPLAVGASPFSGTLTEADFTPVDGGPQTFAEALAAIRDSLTYVNVHTEDNPGGEIRGQLELIPDSATEPAGMVTGSAATLLLLTVVGLAVFLFAFRRFSFSRA